MPNNSICLKGAWTAIVPIILGCLPPTAQSVKSNPTYDHNKHCYSDEHEPMEIETLSATEFCRAESLNIVGINITLPATLNSRNTGLSSSSSRWNYCSALTGIA